MCGLAGIFSYAPEAPPVAERELVRMRDRMASRGPDGAGLWRSPDERVGLAHRRLAIIDLSDSGLQPMWSDCGRYVVVFNGEIYNYRALRADLEAQGERFRSDSDTEVLLNLYRRYGEAMCEHLRGMFAFAVWDTHKRELFMARDTFGIKPLYWHDDGRTLRFASQVKALMAGGAIRDSLEPAAAAGFLVWGHIPEPWTTVAGVTSLPAGHWMRVVCGGRRTAQAFETVTSIFTSARGADEPIYESLRQAAADSVRHHLVADVPAGVFLSSGIDSTTIAGLAAEQSDELITLTLGFDEYRGTERDEAPLAEKVAAHYGARHETVWLKRHDFMEELGQLFEQMDQPSTDGVNTYFVAKAARMAGLKVALSGLGGDELFAGYPSFSQIPQAVRRLAWARRTPLLAVLFGRLMRSLPDSWLSPKTAGLLAYGGSFPGAYLLRRSMRMPEELAHVRFPGLTREVLEAGLQKLALEEELDNIIAGIEGPRAKVSALETSCYMRSQLLRDCDWASMAHSVEVRVPLVDRSLARFVAQLVARGRAPGKRDLAGTPRPPLPADILERPKTGFTVPVREWLLAKRAQPEAHERGLRGWQRFVWDTYTTA